MPRVVALPPTVSGVPVPDCSVDVNDGDKGVHYQRQPDAARLQRRAETESMCGYC